MAKHEGRGQKTQTDLDQKQRVKQTRSQPLLEHFQEWDTGTHSFTDTPFQPPVEQHATLLKATNSDNIRAQLTLQLQHSYGNRYVQRLMESVGAQAKRTVGEPNDIYEQEAAKVADAVTRSISSSAQRQEEEELEAITKPESNILRQEEEEEEPVQMKVPKVQSQPEEEEPVQMMPHLQRQAQDSEEGNPRTKNGLVDPEVESTLQGIHNGGKPVDGTVQRMVVAATENIANVDDALVWNNLEFAASEVGGPVVDMKNWDKFETGNRVRIVGHGAPNAAALTADSNTPTWYNANKIKTRMRAGGLDISSNPNDPNAKKLSELEFQSCYAAKKFKKRTVPPTPAPPPTSLIDRMGTALESIGQHAVSIYGRPGIAFGFRGMGAATAESTEKAYNETMKVLQGRKPQTKQGVYIFDENGDYKNPWELVKTSKRKWDTWSIQDRMDAVADQMEGYWKDFNTEMEKRKGFLKSSDEVKKVVSK